MENTFVLNVIHRPEMVPEYAAKNGDIKKIQEESFDIFRFQQKTAHDNGLKTTIQMTYASLFNDEIIEIAKHDHEKYGDEIALSLLGLPCEKFKEKYKTDEFCIWLFSKEDKMEIIDDAFGMFFDKFGFYPASTGSYFLDAFTINYIKEKYPSVICAIATCWEEGPKAYHTCNNSWYTFMDGGPWNPWIPSKINSHCPAKDKEDDSQIVAIPHLSRDLLACFDGNGSNFGTHPQNVIRGMIYYKEDGTWKYPYLYNLIDQYRHLEKYNNGYAYNMMFVGPGWLNKKGRWEAPYELLKQSYEDGCAYYGRLKKEGKLVDMTMEEFAKFYRANKTYNEPECALWKDILYGSNKQYFWYVDPYLRTCLDFNQGGAMIDFRPYIARVPWEVGIGTDNIYDCSYPYLIQANYRAGFFTHYAGAGTVKSTRIIYKDKEVDLCLTRTLARYEKRGEDTIIITNPVTLDIDDLHLELESSFLFEKGTGNIITTRKILNDIGDKEVTIEEYFTGGFGVNEYQQKLDKVTLGVDEKVMDYEYKDRYIIKEHANKCYVTIPDVNTYLQLSGDDMTFKVQEGIAFSPIYKLSARKTIKKGAIVTCLTVKKAN